MEYIVRLKEKVNTILVNANSNNITDGRIKFYLDGEFVIMFNLDEVVYIANKERTRL